LTLWICTPLVLLLFKRGLRSWYYLDVLYPTPFVAGAIILADLLKYAAPRLRVGSKPLVRSIACVGVLFVAVADVDSLRRLWRLTESSGVMPLPSAIIAGGSVDSSFPVELMPIRYKERIVRAIVKRTHFEPTAFYRRVHGSAFDAVAEDGGFFFETLSGKWPPRPGSDSSLTPHYAVLGPGLTDRFAPPSPLERVGPFTIIEYVPLIDYSSWAYSDDGGAGGVARRLEGGGWTPVLIPTRGIPDVTVYGYSTPSSWPEVPVLLRGEIEVKRVPVRFRLVVALRQHEGDHRVDACRVNEALAPVDGVFAHSTLRARLSETVLNLSADLHEGRNTVTCRISGNGRRFDLDVYELHG